MKRHLAPRAKEPEQLVRVGHNLFVPVGFTPTMLKAYETDMECGAQWLNEAAAKELNVKFPTVVAMAALIEKERDNLLKEVKRLKKLISRASSKRATKKGRE